MKVGYLGPMSSFSHKATCHFFKDAQLQSFSTIHSVLKAVEAEQVNYCVVPIENSVEGTVNPTLDFLYHQGSIPVQAELILPISQNLMVHPRWLDKMEQVKRVKSHPQALAQTEQFLHKHYAEVVQEISESTTQAAKWIHENEEYPVMAIGSKEAAKMYRLTIIHTDIQDMKNNQTRFWLVGKQRIEKPSLEIVTKRQTIGITMQENQAGNLHKILSAFSWRSIDLTKIESRPLKTQLGEYFFLIDVKVENEFLIKMALLEIEDLGGKIKNFGQYKVYQA